MICAGNEQLKRFISPKKEDKSKHNNLHVAGDRQSPFLKNRVHSTHPNLLDKTVQLVGSSSEEQVQSI